MLFESNTSDVIKLEWKINSKQCITTYFLFVYFGNAHMDENVNNLEQIRKVIQLNVSHVAIERIFIVNI